ncbi:MAG: UvrD-helicase domain-containing protein [Anaerolineae bacterium]|nr:UvrD-helicase domain-containing protein [Anaerolineae bacterium]
MDFLEQLNHQQRQAVSAGDGPVLVLAGPGSGKTRVLTQRIAYLIASKGVRPYQILAVTFTNKAAREMKSRVDDFLGELASQGLALNTVDGMMLGTFHAICARILRSEAGFLPIEANYVIFDADDQVRLVKSIVREMNLNDKLYRPHRVHAAISSAKNELISADNYPTATYRDEVVKRVYIEYQKRLIASNAVDFDDLLVYAARLLEDNPEIREKYAQRFRHVLVDEFQDTNIAQYSLIKHLASAHKNIFVVGDPDQSIYAWRGADWRNVQRFEQDYPDAQVILLEQNYRSQQTILDAAMAVIDRARNRRRKKLFTERGEGEKLFYYEAPDDYAEAAFIVDTIAQLVASKQFEPGDCAVMYRTNAQSRLLEEAFLQARLPYRLVGAQRFYGRREVKDMIAYLRLAYNANDEASLNRIINVPTRGIGSKSIMSLNTAAKSVGITLGALILDLAGGSDSAYWQQFSNRAAISLADFGVMLANWRVAVQTLTITELFDRIAGDIGYKEYLEDGTEEGLERWENVTELRRLTQDYATRTLEEFLQDVALISDQDTMTETVNAPTLLTLHAAKGLEFGVVFIIGLDDGLLPHNRSFDEPEQMEEERRLFYVGITRAKDKLYLVRSVQRGGRGYAEETYPSRFLDDIPSDLMIGKARTGPRQAGETLWHVPDGGAGTQRTNPISASVIESKYRAGIKVQHSLWGEGIVLNSRIQDDEEIVEVVFESVGIKRLAASLAKLTVIS